jgi:putative sugar O-methyltransferase
MNLLNSLQKGAARWWLHQRLKLDPERVDLAYQLALIDMAQGRPISPALEEKSLRHALTIDPGRIDLLDRLVTVILLQHLKLQGRRNAQNVTDDRACLEKALKNYSTATSISASRVTPSYGKRWDSYVQRMRDAIPGFTNARDVIDFAQGRVGFEHRYPIVDTVRYYPLYQRELESEFPNLKEHLRTFSDWADSRVDTVAVINGQLQSNIVPYLMRVIWRCLTLQSPPPQKIAEIGGGYGALARLWLSNPVARPEHYFLIDIPETLFFCDVMLRKEFGDDAVLYAQSAESFRTSSVTGHKIVLCPISAIDAIRPVNLDLIINTGSMQEMTEEWVEFYMRWMDVQPARYFYSLNYAAQPLGELAESVNTWSPRPSAHWATRMLRWNPPFVRLQTNRNYLEALYEKADGSLTNEAAERRLSELTERAVTGDVFVECLDIFRRSTDSKIAAKALEVAVAMQYHPKEACWLADYLMGNPGELSKEQRSRISSLHGALVEERNRGVEGTT